MSLWESLKPFGSQEEHKGKTLEQVAHPGEVVIHPGDICVGCGHSWGTQEAKSMINLRSRCVVVGC